MQLSEQSGKQTHRSSQNFVQESTKSSPDYIGTEPFFLTSQYTHGIRRFVLLAYSKYSCSNPCSKARSSTLMRYNIATVTGTKAIRVLSQFEKASPIPRHPSR